MSLFLEIALAFPTVLFTALVGLTALYWIFVILGAVDMDLFGGGDALDGALDGALEGTAHGAAEAAHGMLDGAAEAAAHGAHGLLDGAAEAAAHGAHGAVDGAADAVGHGALDGADGGLHGAEGAVGLLHALGLRRVPITIVFSLVVGFSWMLSYLGARTLRGLELSGAMALLAGGGIGLVALVFGVLLAAVAVRPLAPLFVAHTRHAEERLLGKVVTIRSTRVTDAFGQAEFDDGGAGVLIDVICLAQNGLAKGAEALVVGYDRAQNRYEITPYIDPTLDLTSAQAPSHGSREFPPKHRVEEVRE